MLGSFLLNFKMADVWHSYSVDQHSAEMMQRVIRERCEDKTVIAVVHKLREIVDFDVVLVMHEGQVVESGQPSELLKKDSKFKQLWEGKQI